MTLPPPGPSAPIADLDKLRAEVGRYFTIYETRISPVSVLFLVNVNASTLEANFGRLAHALWSERFIAQIRLEGGEHVIEVVRRPDRKPWSGGVNLVMLALTIVTTVFAGAFLWVAYNGGSSFRTSDLLWGAVFFAAPLLAILGLHELAHYFMARRHHVEASMPFFLPMPPPFVIFGTFGAFISLREPITDKKALMDIGVAGPIAGFLVAIPVTIAGLFLSLHSPVLPLTNCGPVFLSVPYGGTLFGASAVWYALSLFFPLGMTNLNPLAVAGWVGLLITSINLLPAGQLDGGHVFRALLGKRSVWLSLTVVVILIALGFFYPGWFIFAFLVLLLGVRHPPPLNDISPLDTTRKLVGVAAGLILIGGFSLVPIAQPTGDFSTPTKATAVGPWDSYATQANISFPITNQDLVSHGFVLFVNMTPSPGLGANATETYFANMTQCSFTFSGASEACASARANWPTVDLVSPMATVAGGGARVLVTLTFEDRIPQALNGTITVYEICQGVQHLQNGSPQEVSFSYEPPPL